MKIEIDEGIIAIFTFVIGGLCLVALVLNSIDTSERLNINLKIKQLEAKK